MSSKRVKGKLTREKLGLHLTEQVKVDLTEYTPGEIVFLANKVCNLPAGSFPVPMDKSKKIRTEYEQGKFDGMTVDIFHMAMKVKTSCITSEHDATSAVSGADVVVDTRTSDMVSTVYTTSKSIDVMSVDFDALSAQLDSAYAPQSKWWQGVRVDKEETKENLQEKKWCSVVNSLVSYTTDGRVKNQAPPYHKMLEQQRLDKAGKAVAKEIPVSDEIDKDAIYDYMREDTHMRDHFYNKVAVTVGQTYYSKVLTLPTKTKPARPVNKVMRRAPEQDFNEPVKRLANMTTLITDSGVGVRSMSQFDGLPVNSQTRNTMAMVDDIVIPEDVNVVVYSSGNKVSCEVLWRKTGFRKDILFMYPSDSDYTYAKFAQYFSDGNVLKGGVIAYSKEYGIDLQDAVSYYIKDEPHRVPNVARQELGTRCLSATEKLKVNLKLAEDYTYYSILVNVLVLHEELWARQNEMKDKRSIAEQCGLKDVYSVVLPREDSKQFFYVSSHYAKMNCILTNYDRTRYGNEPVPYDRMANVYVNLALWHYMHPIIRHKSSVYNDSFDLGGEEIHMSYSLFPRYRLYPFGTGMKNEKDFSFKLEGMNMDEIRDAVFSVVPKRYRGGRDAVTGDVSEQEDDGDDLTFAVSSKVAQKEEESDEDDFSFAGVFAQTAAKVRKKRLTVGDLDAKS